MSYEIKCVNSIKFQAVDKKTHRVICEGFSPNHIMQVLKKQGIK
jgi:hypothetical protein